MFELIVMLALAPIALGVAGWIAYFFFNILCFILELIFGTNKKEIKQ